MSTDLPGQWSFKWLDEQNRADLISMVKGHAKLSEWAKGQYVPMRGDEVEVKNLYALTDKFPLGQRVKVVRGDCEVSSPVCLGQTGTITGWFHFKEDPSCPFQVILPASCYHMAIVSGDNGQTFHANTSWCEAIANSWDTPPHPGWVLTNRDSSYYHTSGVWRWVPPGDPAAEPVRIGEEGHVGISASYRIDGQSVRCHL